jgi:hypothetical protein
MGVEILFPHLTSTGPAPSYHEVISTYASVFTTRLVEGKIRPVVFPYHMYGYTLLFVYLMIPHTKSPIIYAARWPVAAIIVGFQLKTLMDVSSGNAAFAYVAGLGSTWGVLLTVTLLILTRPQFDAMRVEIRRTGREGGRASIEVANATAMEQNGHADSGKLDGEVVRLNGNGTRYRPQANGATEIKGMEHANGNGHLDNKIPKEDITVDYYWQSYPEDFFDRLSWVADLVTSFRGVGWNWVIPTVPELPPFVKSKLGEPVTEESKSGITSTGIQRFDTRAELFYSRIPAFIFYYLALDFFKNMMMKDPYYVFGPNSYDLPPPLAVLTPFQLSCYRQCLISMAIVCALEGIFMIPALVLCLTLGPKVLGLRGEAWYYPTVWGSFSTVANKGLNGLWGGWWHQTFRFVFAAPTTYLIENGYMSSRSQVTKLVGLVIAFSISGILHCGGSLTQLPLTHPTGPFTFFVLHGLGILIQTIFCDFFRPYIRKLPKPIRQAGNIVFVWIWLQSTTCWLVDDFARGGLFLFEPVPISPFRASGYGVEGDWWWCWGGPGAGWYTGKTWWESGIVL